MKPNNIMIFLSLVLLIESILIYDKQIQISKLNKIVHLIVLVTLLIAFTTINVSAESLNVIGDGLPHENIIKEKSALDKLSSGYNFEKQNGGYKSSYSTDLNKADAFKFEYKGTYVSFVPQSIYLQSDANKNKKTKVVTSKLNGDKLYYQNLIENTTYSLTDMGNLIKEELILYNNPFVGASDSDNVIFEHRFNYSGLDVYVNGALWDGNTPVATYNNIIFKSGSTTYFEFTAPYVYDANRVKQQLYYSISKNWIAIVVPASFLNNQKYPITIDPSLEQNGGSITLDGTHNYDYVNITNSGVVYVTAYNGTGTTGWLQLNVTYDVNIDATSSINGAGRGFGGGGGGSGGAIGMGGAGGSGSGGGGGGGNHYDTGYGGGGAGGASYGTAGGSGGKGAETFGGSGGSAGSTYGTLSDWDNLMGSGGGGGGGASSAGLGGASGGAGGSNLTINARNIVISGSLTFTGNAGGAGGSYSGGAGGGGGGASGGGILLNGSVINLNSATITTAGGGGGAGGSGGSPAAGAGSSGGAGRFKVFYAGSFSNTSTTVTSGTSYYENTNSIPTAPTLTSDLSMNEIDHTPSVTFTKGTDADGDTVTTYIYVDTSNPPTTLEASTSASNIDIGSTTALSDGVTYYIRARSYDGIVFSDYSAVDTFRMNTPPTIPSLIQKANFHSLLNTTVNWTVSTDAESDSITYNDKVYNTTTEVLLFNQTSTSNNYSQFFAPANWTSYNYTARAYDSYEYSDWATVKTFSFTNTVPSYTNVALNPASPTINDNLTISYSLTDAQGDSVTNYTRWYKNNVLQLSLNNKLYVNATGNTSYGQVWRYEIFGNDTYENSTAIPSNEVIIGSTNAAPTFTSLVLIPNSKKYNKTININVSGISDDSTTWQVQTYYLNGSTKVYLANSSWMNATYANLTTIINWSDGGLHTIYAVVYDSGNATGVQNLTSSPQSASFTSLTTSPTLVSSSIDDTTINTGSSVIISSQVDGVGANVSWVKAFVRRPDATSANWTMTCASGENITCSYTYTSTSDVGNYYVDYFYILDDSGNLAEVVPDSTLNFYASTPVVIPPSGGGGGGVPIPTPTPKTNLSDVVLQIKKISPELPSGLTELIAECYTKDVLLEGKCATINLSEPMNWWPLMGAYLASFFTIFGIAIITKKPHNLIVDSLLYGTISIVIIQLIVIMGFNAYFMSYLMQSDLPAFMFVSVVAWSVPIAYMGDSFYSRKVKGKRFKNKKS